MKYQLIILSVIITALCCHFAQKAVSPILNNEAEKEATLLLQEMQATLKDNHFKTLTIDDAFSQQLFEHYLQKIDPKKLFLTQEMISDLAIFKDKIDDELKAANFDFYQQSQTKLQAGIQKANQYYKNILDAPIDWDMEGTFETNPKQKNYATNDQALQERWRKKVQVQLLEALFIAEQSHPNLEPDQQKQQAIDKVKWLLDKEFKQYTKASHKERLATYINSYLQFYDFQTAYLLPKEKKAWDDVHTRSFVGIGARLKIVNNYPKIEEVIIGGPAWKSQSITAGSSILKVAEMNDLAVDLGGMDLKQVIQLLKGKRGSTVNLVLQTPNHLIDTIALVRDKVEMDVAMTLSLEDEQSKHKMAYLRLPRFYGGEEGAAAHVLEALEKIKAANTEGLILDLRNNRGGSASHAREIIGYFIDKGVTMQSSFADGQVIVLEDEDGLIEYDGELIVLVNEDSSSASELFAGNMQDYGRAIIVGQQTFGKGTRQRFFPLEITLDSVVQNMGELKLSVGQFYTASGRSPQYNGITPDITLPHAYAFRPSGERAFPNAIPPSQLSLQDVPQKKQLNQYLSKLQTASQERVADSERFQLIQAKKELLAKRHKETLVPLQYDAYKQYQQAKSLADARFEAIFDPIATFKVGSLGADSLTMDSIGLQKQQRWMKKIQGDPYVEECFWIMEDLLRLG